MSTPTSLELPAGVRRITVASPRGTFAALEALPASGVPDLGTALLVPGYTGSKEDFINVLYDLAEAGRRVIAVDLRGQHETSGPDESAAYSLASLGQDMAELADVTETEHLLGHSFGGLVVREAILGAGYAPTSLTLLSSGPSAVPGSRARQLTSLLTHVGDAPVSDYGTKIAEIWHGQLKPDAVSAGTPADILAFLERRTLNNNPVGLVTMAKELLSAPDRTDDLAKAEIPSFVLYGEDDNAWPTEVQEEMAARLGAQRFCIPAAAHSPNVEAPATTAHALTDFWNKTEVSA